MSKVSIIILACIVIASCYLSACSFWGDGVPTAEINIDSAQYLNPAVNGRTSPVVLTIYQLKNKSVFKSTDYSALATNSSQVLGGDLLDKSVVEVRPGSHIHISQPLTVDIKYIGVTAAYRDIDKATWRKVIAVDITKNKTSKIDINLESEALNVSIKK